MSRNRKPAQGLNVSPVFIWLLLTGGIAYGIYKISHAVKQVNEVHDAEVEERRYHDSINKAHQVIIYPADTAQ